LVHFDSFALSARRIAEVRALGKVRRYGPAMGIEARLHANRAKRDPSLRSLRKVTQGEQDDGAH